MIKIKSLFAFMVIGIILISCSKDDDKVKDCESKNYGIVTVKFEDITKRHTIDVTVSGGSDFTSKFVDKGVVSDTVHLKPDYYTVVVSEANSAGQSLGSEEIYQNRLVEQCGNQTINTTN